MAKTDNRVAIGARIKELRGLNGLTQEKLAAMAGTSRGALSSIERGERGYSVDVLDRIVKALGVTYVEFFQGVDGAETLLKRSEQRRNGQTN